MTQPLRIALPKGRLFDQTLAFFAAVLGQPTDLGRRLVVPVDTRATLGVPTELLILKNSDVPVYVEHGVAQLGVVGSDVLDEAQPDVLRLLDLPFGSCRMSVAARAEQDPTALARREHLRVATKYPATARAHFAQLGQQVDLVELQGSVELGAVLGLTDVIVDLVESGRTLRDNGLVELETLAQTTVQVIAARSMTHLHARAIDRLMASAEVVP